jgi:hypothetical protein
VKAKVAESRGAHIQKQTQGTLHQDACAHTPASLAFFRNTQSAPKHLDICRRMARSRIRRFASATDAQCDVFARSDACAHRPTLPHGTRESSHARIAARVQSSGQTLV